MKRIGRVLLLIIIFVFSNCKEDKKLAEANRIVKEWVGKTIQFPVIESFCLSNKNTFPELSGKSKNYKILLYADFTDCTNCQLILKTWQMYMKEFGEKMDFLFYFFPQDKKELLSILKNIQFNYPIYIDEQDELNKLNKLPTNQSFQCFLLDKDNKVVLLGNPINNYKIWELYKKQLFQHE